MIDLVIKNGTIVDGTGRPSYRGDVAISDGSLVQVGGTVTDEAREVIDAEGLIVTPGFVDIHSHYDGQVTFDDALEPSAGHGVTTVVMGSCGIGFAPARRDDHDRLIEVMEWVEDIPGAVLREALPWNWETYPEYLDAIEQRSYSMDVGSVVGHVAVRINVMGERGVCNEQATNADIDTMAAIVGDAIHAGALGFSTSRLLGHKGANGEPIPGTFADDRELTGIAAAVSDAGGGVFQVAQLGADGDDAEAALKEFDWMRRLALEFDLRVSFLVLQTQQAPDLWKEVLDRAWDARADGAAVYPQVANRPFGILLGLTNRHPFTQRPTFVELAARHDTVEALVAELAEPDVRAQILGEPDSVDTEDRFVGMGSIPAILPTLVFPLGGDVDYEPTAATSLGARADALGVSPVELFYDLMLEHDGRTMFLVPFFGYAQGSHDAIYGMLTHPASVMGLADGGAHLASICDASLSTYQLSHWVKGRTRGPRLDLETAVKMQTSETAELYGLGDRGTLEVGKKADVNVIDLDALRLELPRAEHDLPGGGLRLLQDAVGYVATIVSGVVTRRNDTDTGARPGRLVRGAR